MVMHKYQLLVVLEYFFTVALIKRDKKWGFYGAIVVFNYEVKIKLNNRL